MTARTENGISTIRTTGEICDHQEHDSYLFCPYLLKSITFTPENMARFQPPLDPLEPGHGLLVRPLRIDDYEKGYIDLLGYLTVAGSLSQGDFEMVDVLGVFNSMKAAGIYFIVVVEDRNAGRIVGSTTLLIEQKIFRNATLRGRIEDVVVSSDYRGKQLGKLLVVICTELGRQHFQCYKMSLDCKEHLTDFYGALGYKREPGVNTLLRRFDCK